jgi:tetratricopeptide (TPR) repeat protein
MDMTHIKKFLNKIHTIQFLVIFIGTTILLPSLAKSEQNADHNKTDSASVSARNYYEAGRKEYLKFTPGSFNSAIENFTKALELDPKFAPAYAGLGEVNSFIGFYRLEVKDDYEKFFNQAYHNILKALEYGPNLLETQRALAINYLHLSRKGDAEAAANRALQMNPNDAESYYVIWAANGKKPSDQSIWKALSLDPSLVMAHVDLATAYFFNTRDYNKAADQYKKAVELADSPQLHNYLGTTFRSQGYFPRAIEEYKKAIDLDPNFAPAHMNLGITLFYMNKFNESIEKERKAISINSRYPDSYFFLARSYEATNNPQMAIKNYNLFLDLVREQENYYNYIATAKKSLAKLQLGPYNHQ